MEVNGTAHIITGRGRPLLDDGGRDEGGGHLLGRVMQHLSGWGKVEGEGKRKDDEDEEVVRAVLWLQAALEVCAVVDKGEDVIGPALRKAQEAPWRGVREPSGLLVAMQELLTQLPLALGHGKGLEDARALGKGEEGVTVAELGKEVVSALGFLKHRVEEMLVQMIPTASGGRSRASSEDEIDVGGDLMEGVVASRSDDSEGEELMRDIDDEDESPRPRGRGRVAAPRKVVNSPPRRTNKKQKLAMEVGVLALHRP
jgi:hypothetical protein